MNKYLRAALQQINLHGQVCSYAVVQEGTYDVETGSTSNTETSYSVKMYKKHIRATQYNYPNLVGRDVAMFYLVNYNLGFTPAVRDKITLGSDTYTVDSIQSHAAEGAVVLFRIIAVKQ